MRICVVFNPSAKGDKARAFRRHLVDLGPGCALKPTSAPGDAYRLAKTAIHDGFDVIVAAGGDGTINEVLNGIADTPNGLAETRLGVLPLGTANVFARELRLPLNWRRAWQWIADGVEQPVDLVRARFNAGGRTTSRHFVQVAGAGLDARATEIVSWEWKKRVGFLAYVMAGLNALRERQQTIFVETDNGAFSGELVLLGNGRLYGGPFPLFPLAAYQDGLLDVRIFPKAGPRLAVAILFGLFTGRVGHVGGSTNLRVERLTLSATARVPLQLDGEFVGELPADLEIVPCGLRVIAPLARHRPKSSHTTAEKGERGA
jgi:YegS/Rv2252/BmrU family lipid kinase